MCVLFSIHFCLAQFKIRTLTGLADRLMPGVKWMQTDLWCSTNQRPEDAFWMSQSWCLVCRSTTAAPPPKLVSEIGKSTKDQHHHRVARIFLKHTLMHLFLSKRKFTGRSVRVDFRCFLLTPVSNRKTALEEQAAACCPPISQRPTCPTDCFKNPD